jgi:flavin-dependent dehydrogenase
MSKTNGASKDSFDVVICGGGLAGLTLALQLRKYQPERSVLVVERQKRPLPDACHKVGESSVEIGAHYFEHVIGLRSYLDARQLRKNGLRFFSGVPGAPIHERCELGPSERPTVPSFQLDRGRLENDLRAMVEESGAELREGWGVRDIELSKDGDHTIVLVTPENEVEHVRGRWVVDATGRRRILQKKLGLHRDSPHQAGASWWRVKGRFDIKDLVDPDASRWHARDIGGQRWLSTIHLCGTGYWFWLIPLSTDHWSLGIVAETASHDFRTFGKPETAKEWVQKHEPHVWKKLEGLPWEDFIAFKDYRYDSARVMSADRWTCVGEAGVFVDPLYSPGSDFIGVSNSLTCELIADDFAGRLDAERADELNRFMLRFEDLTSETLALGSQVFGKPEVTAGKLYWDYLQYWAFMCQYFFQRIYRLPVAEHRRFSALLDRWIAMNHRAQSLLQAWAKIAPYEPAVEFVHLPRFPSTLADLHLDLQVKKDPEKTYRDMEEAARIGEECLGELVLRALRRAGPARAAEFAAEIELSKWELAIDERRLIADEAEPQKRRKLLPKSIRDMERALGKSAADSPDAPKLRELWASVAPHGG